MQHDALRKKCRAASNDDVLYPPSPQMSWLTMQAWWVITGNQNKWPMQGVHHVILAASPLILQKSYFWLPQMEPEFGECFKIPLLTLTKRPKSYWSCTPRLAKVNLSWAHKACTVQWFLNASPPHTAAVLIPTGYMDAWTYSVAHLFHEEADCLFILYCGWSFSSRTSIFVVKRWGGPPSTLKIIPVLEQP